MAGFVGSSAMGGSGSVWGSSGDGGCSSGRSGVDGEAGFVWVCEGERGRKQLGRAADEPGLVPERFRPFCADSPSDCFSSRSPLLSVSLWVLLLLLLLLLLRFLVLLLLLLLLLRMSVLMTLCAVAVIVVVAQ